MAFENGILRQIFGPIKVEDEWRRRKNREIRNLYQLPDIVAVIKVQRLRLYGHVMRRDGDLVKDASKQRDHTEDFDSDGLMQSRKTLERGTELFGEG
ncbi:hypothetical protein PR048_023873 [Dryococelus australis]|uniref:Uncharacterized protein n=1 Tax=Dryococelus australis TaxID=614101 RepID=A0ABQ9GV94_9NEOP|nr:hypothetical protein PR048_023873 [Dryococelus australis]